MAARFGAPRRIAATSGGRLAVVDASGTLRLLTRRGDLLASVMRGVYGVTAGAGKVFVTNDKLELVTLDEENGKVVGRVGLGESHGPTAIAYDSARDVIWMVFESGKVEARRTDGSLVTVLSGAKTGLLFRLVDIAVDAPAGILWVAQDREQTGGMVVGLSVADGTRLKAIGTTGTGPAKLAGAIAVGSDGRVYVADIYAGKVAVVDAAGVVVQTIGVSSTGAGLLSQPAGLAFMVNGDLIVSNLFSNRIDRYGDGSPLPVCEGDADCDGMPDAWESAHGLDPLVAADALADLDGDGLTNLQEFALGTNPGSADSDGDGYADAEELATGFNPADPYDHRPVVVAGATAEYAPGLVPLSASVRSSDPSACTATWQQVGGDAVALSGAEGFAPSFLARKAGTYRFSVVATCGATSSEPAEVAATVLNLAPLADAPRVVAVESGEYVSLNAGRSSDANADALAFEWVQLSGAVVTAGGTGGTLRAHLERPGSYQFKVTVRDSASAAGEAVTDVVALGSARVPAVAVVTPVIGAVGQSISLDASGSDRSDEAAFAWEQVAGPRVALSGADAPVATFEPTVPGRYAFKVGISQHRVASPPGLVEVFVAASAQSLPVAVASAPAVAPVGAAVVLDGGASTGGAGGALEYAWRQVSGPAAGLGATNRAVASAHLFSPGAYEFELTVTDAAGVGVPTRVRVEGRLDGRAIPVARIVAPASAHRGQSVRLDGRSSTGGTRFRWTQTGGPWVLLDQASTASFRPRAPGNYVFELEVDDGQVRSAPARVSVLVTGVDTEEE